LEGLFGAGQYNKVVGIGENGDGASMVLEGSTGEGLGLGDALAYNQFHREVEKDSTEGAALLDARVDGDGGCLAERSYYFSGSTSVYLANHLHQVWGKAHVGEGGQESRMWDAAKGIADIQPGDA
jgi:hypothetical protein